MRRKVGGSGESKCCGTVALRRQRSPYPAMGVCAVGAWLVRCMWLGMLANKMSYDAISSNGRRGRRGSVRGDTRREERGR
eukprot:scaffold129193_cov28-Tisochrysis_lutea.AAC.1